MTDQNGVERSRTELTATKRLRAMLDERGIEWRRPPHYSSESKDNETIFRVNGFEWYAYDEGNGYLSLRTCKLLVTPEQAIAATVGEEHEMHICKRCGVAYELNIIDKGFGKPRFCPNCGHREVYQ